MLHKLWELFYRFFLIGLFTIGGGYAMIPMITDAVLQEGWLSMDELMNFFAIAESTPGPFAVNTATLIGFTYVTESPVLGAIIATTAVVLPSFIIIYIIARNFHHLMDNKYIVMALNGIKAVVVGLIISVVWGLVATSIGIGAKPIQEWDYYALIIIVIIFVVSKLSKKIGPIPLIILSGILGYNFYGLL
jgi:chromate transporter